MIKLKSAYLAFSITRPFSWFIGALAKYHEVNGALPERIIVFRDGVGDGQLEAVVEHEIPQMIECFKKAGGTEYR